MSVYIFKTGSMMHQILKIDSHILIVKIDKSKKLCQSLLCIIDDAILEIWETLFVKIYEDLLWLHLVYDREKNLLKNVSFECATVETHEKFLEKLNKDDSMSDRIVCVMRTKMWKSACID